MSNRASSFPATPQIPPLHRYGGVLTSMPELPMHALGDAYLVEGSATVLGMPAWPKGPPILLHIIGSPTFVHSSKLLMPGRQNCTFSPGDSAWLLPLGDGIWRVITISRADGIPYVPGGKTLFPAPQGRLSLEPGTALTTSNFTGATSVYWTQNEGDMIALYDANTATWIPIGFDETALSLSGAANGTNFDLFGYLDANRQFAMEKLAWTNDSKRATAIATQNGIDVKNGDPSRRLLGTIRTIDIAGQTEDSETKRFVSNRYNAALRSLIVRESAGSWPYSASSWHQANGNAANQVDLVNCVSRFVSVELLFMQSNSAAFGTAVGGIGVNTTSTDSSTTKTQAVNPAAGGVYNGKANFEGYLAAGRSYIAWLEYSVPGAGQTMTWYGTLTGSITGGDALRAGLNGYVLG